MDNYYGNFDNGNGAPNRDIIGAANLFETTKMDVSSVGGNLNVTIYSDYLDNVGYGNTELGDLFISTNGWQVLDLRLTLMMTTLMAVGNMRLSLIITRVPRQAYSTCIQPMIRPRSNFPTTMMLSSIWR